MKNLISRWKIQKFQQTLFTHKIWDPSKHSSLGSSISSSKISYSTFIFFQHVSLINLKFFNVIKNKKISNMNERSTMPKRKRRSYQITSMNSKSYEILRAIV